MAPSASAVLDALGDPTRRSILDRLSGGPLPVGVLAAKLPVSRPAVSQHLKVLRQAELVLEQSVGTRRLYRIDQYGLAAARGSLDRFWDSALQNFARLAADEAEQPNRHPDLNTETRQR